MINRLFSRVLFFVCLLSIIGAAKLTVEAQTVQGLPKADKAPGPIGKSPNTATIILPRLRLRGAEAFHIGGSDPKDFHKIIFTFSNWDSFPAQWFKPEPDSPTLPPNPCRQTYTPTRMFLILHSEDGKLTRCTALTAKGDFYFLLEKGKPIPEFVYVEVTDRTNGMKFKSTLVSPSTGQIK